MAAQAARKARKSRPTARERMIEREIVNLRSDIGRELAKHASGINLRLGDISEEYVPELQGLHSRVSVYERMANDPNVSGQLRAIWLTIISGVRWNAVGGKESLRQKIAANLLRQGPRKFWCAISWNDFLYQALAMLVYGFSMFAKSRQIVDGTMIYSDLKWLHPRSVDEDGWVMDEADNLIQVRRSFQDATGKPHTREPIGIDDLFLMNWGRRGPNWEGTAFIRPMYRPWKLGEMAEKIDMIDLQNRGVGIPMAKLAGGGGARERDALLNILSHLRGGSKELAFLVIQKDEDVSFLTSTGTAKDAQPTLQHHRASMVKAGGQEYFEQGNTATGSRAGASALATGFFVSVDGIIRHIEDVVNYGCGPQMGLVEEFCYVNDEDADESDIPTIRGSRVSPTEQLDNIPLVQDSVSKGLVPTHRKLANEALRRLGWPELSEDEWEEAMEAKRSSVFIGGGGAGRPNEAGPDEQGRDDKDGRRLMMQEKKTPGAGSLPRRSPPSWPWLRSSPA